jgi:hypothetical protein
MRRTLSVAEPKRNLACATASATAVACDAVAGVAARADAAASGEAVPSVIVVANDAAGAPMRCNIVSANICTMTAGVVARRKWTAVAPRRLPWRG